MLIKLGETVFIWKYPFQAYSFCSRRFSLNLYQVQGLNYQIFFLFILLVFFLCIRYVDSERRFQHVLEACGVNKSLMKLGVKEGDTVIVGEVCLNYFLISLSLHFESFITFSFFFLGCLLMDHDVNLQICLVMLKRKS